MSYSTAIVQGFLLGLFIAISVGPTLFAVIRYSMHHSFKAGIAFVLGVSFSDIIYVTLANLATDWLDFLDKHSTEVGYIGSILFMIMGLYGFFKKYKPKKPPRTGKPISISKGAYIKIWSSGFLMNTLNPAVLLLWVGSLTLVSGAGISKRAVLYGVCLGVVLGIDFLKVFLAEKIRNKLTLRKIMYLNKVSAIFIFVLGLILFFKVYYGVEIGH